MMRRLILTLAGVLLAAPAVAAPWLTGCENGACLASNATVFSAISGTPLAEPSTTTATDGDPDNDWSIEVNPASAAAEWMAHDPASAQGTLTAAVSLRVNSAPTIERILPIDCANGGSRQCLVTLSPDLRLRLYYGDTGKECAQATNNGQPCTTAADCTEVNPGEASCVPGTFAKSPALTLGTWHRIGVTQDTNLANAADVSLGLWVDCQQRGTTTRPQGLCAGGANAGQVCASDAACPSSSCTFTNKTTARVRFGATGTEASALDINIDNARVWPGVVDTTVTCGRLVDLHPIGTALEGAADQQGCAGASNNHQCVDDTLAGTSTINGDTDYVQLQGTNTEWYDLENITLNDACTGAGTPDACCSGADAGTCESIPADTPLALQCAVRETLDNANASAKTIQFGVVSSGGTERYSGTDQEIAAFGDTTFGTTTPSVFTADWSSGAWDLTDLNAVRLAVKHTGTDSSGFRVRVTDCHAEAWVPKVLPPAPDTLTDQNGDNEITVCWTGDSRFFDVALQEELGARLTQPDNLISLAVGGRRTGDLLGSWTNVLNGVGDANYPATVVKGQNAKCDYITLDIGVNDMFPGWPEGGVCYQQQCVGGANGGLSCKTDTDCPGSTCGTGPRHGQRCGFPAGYASNTWLAQSYCRAGAEFALRCASGLAGLLPVETATPNTCAGSSAQTGCAIDDTALCTGSSRRDSIQCPGGVCVAPVSSSYVHDSIAQMVTLAQARTGANAVKVILVAPFPTWSAADFATMGSGCGWGATRGQLENQRSWVRAFAAARGLDVIDLWAEFVAQCPNRDPDECLRDGVHLTDRRICTCDTDADCGTNGECIDGKHCRQGCASCDQTRINCDSDAQCATGQHCLAVSGDGVVGKAFEDCFEGNSNPNVSCTHL